MHLLDSTQCNIHHYAVLRTTANNWTISVCILWLFQRHCEHVPSGNFNCKSTVISLTQFFLVAFSIGESTVWLPTWAWRLSWAVFRNQGLGFAVGHGHPYYFENRAVLQTGRQSLSQSHVMVLKMANIMVGLSDEYTVRRDSSWF